MIASTADSKWTKLFFVPSNIQIGYSYCFECDKKKEKEDKSE